MRQIPVTLALALVPAVLVAQQSSSTSASANANVQASARAQATMPTLPAQASAEARAKIEAAFNRARAQKVPTAPMEHRLAEGQAKGASSAALAVAMTKYEAQLEASQRAFVKAGRQPSDGETEAGAEALARGVTEVQLEGFAKKAPADRSLEVALNTLTELRARGVASERALAQIEANLQSHASDATIAALVNTGNAVGSTTAATHAGVGVQVGATASGGANSQGATTATAATGSIGAGAAAGAGSAIGGAAAGAGSATGTVTGGLSGTVLKRP